MTRDTYTSGDLALAFGPFRLFPTQRVLLRADEPVPLGSRAREILIALVERAGKLVRKSELCARVWPDTVVEDGTLRVHIAALRRALQDGHPRSSYVENVTGQGYRFVAPVTRVEGRRFPSAAPAPTAEPPNNLPASLSRVIGREQVVSTLAAQLPQRRFMTLVGPGGIGKTTVAVSIANLLYPSYAHGVCFVDLACVGDPLLISTVVAAALGLSMVPADPTPGIVASLKHKQMLLVLDNCEHVIEGAAVLAEKLLGGAPGAHVLATSREPLRANGEWVLRLAPLELPPSTGTLTAAEALVFPAIQLFAERATASLASFVLADTDVPTVADICRRLDGLPLAIELAAARVELLGIRGLAARLDNRLKLLTMGRRTASSRHRTLRATMDWGYELLSPFEQSVLRRLAVFPGLFDAASACAVAADTGDDPQDVLEALASLGAKSLLVVHASERKMLYRLLETSRAYALEKLADADDRSDVRRRHAQLCCAWRRFAPGRALQPTDDWLAANSYKIDDIRAALDWCLGPGGDAALAMRLSALLVPSLPAQRVPGAPGGGAQGTRSHGQTCASHEAAAQHRARHHVAVHER
jgi:predicted ATPase/DNA-binding winged helix-turn-helix (wHTH) protein